MIDVSFEYLSIPVRLLSIFTAFLLLGILTLLAFSFKC